MSSANHNIKIVVVFVRMITYAHVEIQMNVRYSIKKMFGKEIQWFLIHHWKFKIAKKESIIIQQHPLIFVFLMIFQNLSPSNFTHGGCPLILPII